MTTRIPAAAPRNILVMHSEPIVAIGLVAALRPQPGYELFVHGVDHLLDSGPLIDIVLADYCQAVHLAGKIRAGQAPIALRGARLLALSTHDREQQIRQALELGVHGYLLMGSSLEELCAAVDALACGVRHMSAQAARLVADSLLRPALTGRESDVLRLLAQGCCNKTIARRLEIGVGTVKTHVRAILGKLTASSRTEAASIAARLGLADTHEAELPALRAARELVWTA